MSTFTLFKDAITQSKFQVKTKDFGETKVLSFEIKNFKIYLKFLNEILAGTFCEYFDKLFSKVPHFVLAHCRSLTENKIQILEKNFFLYYNNESIHYIQTKKIAMDHITNFRKVFVSFNEKVIKAYNEYVRDTKEWLISNCPEKSESLYALWNAPEDDYLIDVSEKEYYERNLTIPAKGFVPFKVMVSAEDFYKTEVRLMIESEKGFRYYSYSVSADINFGNMLEEFANLVSNGGPYEDPNSFVSIKDSDQILKHILEHAI